MFFATRYGSRKAAAAFRQEAAAAFSSDKSSVARSAN
jgi:hypothetical protein